MFLFYEQFVLTRSGVFGEIKQVYIILKDKTGLELPKTNDVFTMLPCKCFNLETGIVRVTRTNR